MVGLAVMGPNLHLIFRDGKLKLVGLDLAVVRLALKPQIVETHSFYQADPFDNDAKGVLSGIEALPLSLSNCRLVGRA